MSDEYRNAKAVRFMTGAISSGAVGLASYIAAGHLEPDTTAYTIAFIGTNLGLIGAVIGTAGTIYAHTERMRANDPILPRDDTIETRIRTPVHRAAPESIDDLAREDPIDDELRPETIKRYLRKG